MLTSVANLAEAKQQLSADRFDLVLLDIGLPDGSGLDLLEFIHAQTPAPEVIIFSADDRKILEVSGVTKALIKSKTTNEELIEIIRETL